jgi:hypothetical protein
VRGDDRRTDAHGEAGQGGWVRGGLKHRGDRGADRAGGGGDRWGWIEEDGEGRGRAVDDGEGRRGGGEGRAGVKILGRVHLSLPPSLPPWRGTVRDRDLDGGVEYIHQHVVVPVIGGAIRNKDK